MAALLVGLAGGSATSLRAATTNAITSFGITYHFSEAREFGQFANGEYWVLGPVTITRIEPDFTNGANGWEVNPRVQTAQGFQSDGPHYDPSRMPALPYTASTDQSIVKVIGGKVRHSVVVQAAVLTVLMQTPPDNGAGIFRPPYIGEDKPLYRVADLRTDLLPSLLPTVGAPSLPSVTAAFSKGLRMDHHITNARQFRPSDVLWDYQPGNTIEINEALLRLMLNDPLEDKMPALIQVTQHAIDRGYAVVNGYRRSGTGHNPNHRILAGWAAALLDITEVADALAVALMHEDEYVSKRGEVAVWGQVFATTEAQYWNHVMTGGGSQSHMDPYGFIDGGRLTSLGAAYQSIVSQSWKGQVLATHLMPALAVSWWAEQWPILSEYVDRWVDVGVWAIPDPAAPYDGNDLNYGVTYGPDPENPGSPIPGSGRFPQWHGSSRDGGQYRSEFVAAMWNAYREAEAVIPSTISQFGVTFHFADQHEHGQFANGDYWVLGPVTITRIEPDFYEGHHGWEVNPMVQTPQGFQSDGPHYEASRMPALPYTASTDQSIVKVIGGSFRHSVVRQAVVLTVLTNMPPDGGAEYFRPPYIGDDKPLYRVADLNTHLLPTLEPVDSAPSLQSVVDTFSKGLRMDHHSTNARQFRPSDVLWDYQPGNTIEINEALLRLMLNDPLEDKLPALIQVTQHAIDRGYAVLGGYRHSGTGHNPNHRILAGWAAALLDITAVADELQTALMHEDLYVSKLGEVALWGQVFATTEAQYWNYIMTGAGSRSHRDPYGFIDGGALATVGAGYQNIVSQSWKGQVLATRLMPALAVSWRAEQWPILSEYADRWVDVGVWAKPDPAAPYDGNNENYGVTYGPDPDHPGSAIPGSGRSPEWHGANRDGGQYRSEFVAAVWQAYIRALPRAPTDLRIRPE